MRIRIIYLHHRLADIKFAEGDRNCLIGNIQKSLSEKGFYQAEVNNIYDANTAEAVSRFQDIENLAVTGHVDPLTFCRLNSATHIEVETKEKSRFYSGLPRSNILITKSDLHLTLFDGNQPLRQFPVAVGKPSTPTPEGNFAIATKIINPGGVLGSRWMGLNFGSYGIHGTNAPWAIGTMISHGCIRMHNNHAEELFSLIHIGTPVFIRD